MSGSAGVVPDARKCAGCGADFLNSHIDPTHHQFCTLNCRQRTRRAENWEAVRADRHERYLARKEIVAAQARAYRAANGERLRLAQHELYLRKKDLITEQTRAWRLRNPDASRGRVIRRRARLRGLTEHHTVAEWQALVSAYGGRCAMCLAHKPLTRDHIVPLTKGGSDLIDNIQPLCQPCNSGKQARLIPPPTRALLLPLEIAS